MNIQPILHIAEICHQRGIKHAIISPGSRSAPITLGFAHHSSIQCHLINDERSAGFIAMGMALRLNEPVVLVCTSGTAALNYAPTIAEAYYQQIPLLVLTADRPPELIDQQDGQCLRQFEVYTNYIKASFQTPDRYDQSQDEEKCYQVIQDAITKTTHLVNGPVHVNIPIREPFYPTEPISFSHAPIIDHNPKDDESDGLDFSLIANKISSTRKVLFIAGQQQADEQLSEHINKLINELHYPVIADINSNLTSVSGVIQMEDHIFRNISEDIDPEIIITFGNSILSKALKVYFRKRPIEHWHVAETQPVPDFFFQLTGSRQCKPLDFFAKVVNFIGEGDENFFVQWQEENKRASAKVADVLRQSAYSEPTALFQLLPQLPASSHIHLANSMAVRWVNMIGVDADKYFTIQSNRGVSGIDGCTSTAVGYSYLCDQPNFLITGDIAFFYDRNAFWNDFVSDHFKIILLNNHSGGIFNLIDGPGNIPDKLPYFTSSQSLTAASLAQEFRLDYFQVKRQEDLHTQLEAFINSSNCSILELETDNAVNKEVFETLKKINQTY